MQMARRRPRPAATGPSVFEQADLALEVDEALEFVEVTWTRRKGDRVKKDVDLGVVSLITADGRRCTQKLLCSHTGTIEQLFSAPTPQPQEMATLPHLSTGSSSGASLYDSADEREVDGDERGGEASKPRGLKRLILGRVSYCPHPCLTDGRMCAVCGEVITPAMAEGLTRVFVQGGHHVSVSQSEADSITRAMSKKLWESRKLNLILDIDLTLLHATIDPRAQEIQHGDVRSFDVGVPGRMMRHWCSLRPGLMDFLHKAQELYVLTIYTHGRRDYAQQVAKILDADRLLFKDRIVSRDDCPDLQGQKSLQRLFPGGIEMALIMDDNPHVWQGEQSRHLLPVLPFYFYTDFAELNRVAGTPAPNLRPHTDPKTDTQLIHSLRVLERVHAMYFSVTDEPHYATSVVAGAGQPRLKNVADCLAAYRRRVLSGFSLVFSGLLPKGVDPRTSDLGCIAQALGAEVSIYLSDRTTHVVAENPSTEKVFHASKREGVHVVTRLWLQLSFLHCEKKDEKDFRLLVSSSKRPPPPPNDLSNGSEKASERVNGAAASHGHAVKRARPNLGSNDAEAAPPEPKGEAPCNGESPACEDKVDASVGGKADQAEANGDEHPAVDESADDAAHVIEGDRTGEDDDESLAEALERELLS